MNTWGARIHCLAPALILLAGCQTSSWNSKSSPIKVTSERNDQTEVGQFHPVHEYRYFADVKKSAWLKITLHNEQSLELNNIRVRWAFLLDNSDLLSGERICSLAPKQRLTFDTGVTTWSGRIDKGGFLIPLELANWNVAKLHGHVVEVLVDGQVVANQCDPNDVIEQIELKKDAPMINVYRGRLVNRSCPPLALSFIRDNLSRIHTVPELNKAIPQPCGAFYGHVGGWKLDDGNFLMATFNFKPNSGPLISRAIVIDSNGKTRERICAEPDPLNGFK